MQESWTIHRLKSLKPGEVMRYYRGSGRAPGGPQCYTELVDSIFACAEQLERKGRVALEQKSFMVDKLECTDYLAIGL